MPDVIWTTRGGGVVSDISPEEISGGGLYLTTPETGALNIRSSGSGTNVSPDYEPIRGDLNSHNFAAPTVQNAIFRITIVNTTGEAYAIDIRDANGNLITTGVPLVATTGNIAADIAAFEADIIAKFPITQSYNISSTVVSSNQAYITLEITTVPYWDYTINNSVLFSTVQAEIDVLQEGIDPSMLGFWRPLGSDSKTGDLFQFWTTRIGLENSFAIDTVTDNGAGLYLITTLLPHNLIQNQSFKVTGTGTTADGTWIGNVTGTNTVEALGSTWVSNSATGTLISNIFGYGGFSVASKNENDGIWQSFMLLRSKEFNFTDLHEIDDRSKKKQDLNIANYFTDDFNNYRAFYYKGNYFTDGALAINGGKYSYGSIFQEILLDVSQTGFDLRVVDQIQSGGNLPSGNMGYAARFGTSAGKTFTNWGLYSAKRVPAAVSSENGSGYDFFGSPEGTPTPKQNVLEITNPVPGIFDIVEIAAINYLDSGFSGQIIGRYVLTGTPTQRIVHNGFELGSTNLDIGTLNNITLSIAHGANIELINNRLVKSRLTLNEVIDFRSFFESLTFSINRRVVPDSIGSYIGLNLNVGEYQKAMNVYNYSSLMRNERYRDAWMVELKAGGFIPVVFWSRDYIINTDATQPGCTGALPDYDLTTGTIGVQQAYSFYVTYGNFNGFNTLINGVKFKDLVKRIYHCRCKVSNPQVLADGFITKAVSNFVGDIGVPEVISWEDPNNPGTFGRIGEFPFVAGFNESTFPSIAVNYAYGDVTSPDNFTYLPNYGTFRAPDLWFGHKQITPQNGVDIIKNFGQATISRGGFPEPVPPYDYDYYLEGNGETAPFVDVLIDEGAVIGKGESVTLNALMYSNRLVVQSGATTTRFDASEGIAVYSALGTFDNLTGNPDTLPYGAQYFRAIADGDTQYGQKVDSKYEYTGNFLDINDNSPATFDVFGGDCFTQATYVKVRYPNQLISPLGFGQGYRVYSQNRINSQMRNKDAGSLSAFMFPDSSLTVQLWLKNPNLESISYNEGYTLRNEITSYAAFDPLAEYQTDWRNAEMWSNPEAEGSAMDQLRVTPALNQHFEDYNYGYITDFLNINEEAFVIQQRRSKRAYFNSNAVFSTVEGTEIITGDGGVMNQKGLTVSQFGTSIKGSVRIGKNQRGNDVVYGIDPDNKCIWRYGYDGEDNVSEMQLIASFCRNNLNFLSYISGTETIYKDNTAHAQGICSFANQMHREIGWTIRAWKDGIQEWTEPMFHVEHEFDNTNGNGSYGDLIEVNGVLYGTTAFGGATTAGIVFSFNPVTGTFTNLFDFTFGSVAEGYQPTGGLVYINNKLYGIAQLGGANAVGTIYSINTDGTGFVNEFDMVVATGATGLGEMTAVGAVLYGMTSAGGANGFGTIFVFSPGSGTYIDKIDFTGTIGAAKGAAPQGKLYWDGTFVYGMTRQGGVNNTGVLFQYDGFTYNVLHEFSTILTTGQLAGSNPIEGVTKVGNKLYGTAQFGGLTNTGVLFEYDLLTLTYTNLHDFILSTGAEPQSTPTVVGNKLFGTTRIGGSTGNGTIWEYDTVTNIYTKISDLAPPDIFPRGQLLLFNNSLYGTSVGTTIGNFGTIFSYSLAGYYVAGSVVQYGTTSFEQIPAFYIALVDNVSVPPGTDPTVWELVLTTDNRFYSFYTIVYSELKDVFQLFMSPKAAMYWQYKDTYGTTRAVGDTGKNYEANIGSNSPPIWWDDGSTSLVGDAFFDIVYNVPKGDKTFVALRYLSEGNPERVEVFNNNFRTYMNPIDMERREGKTEMSIMNDATVTTVGLNGASANPFGLNSVNSSKIWGKFAVVRTIMRTYNKINTIVCNLRTRARTLANPNVQK